MQRREMHELQCLVPAAEPILQPSGASEAGVSWAVGAADGDVGGVARPIGSAERGGSAVRYGLRVGSDSLRGAGTLRVAG